MIKYFSNPSYPLTYNKASAYKTSTICEGDPNPLKLYNVINCNKTSYITATSSLRSFKKSE